jgi:hypothetical protein
MMKIENEREYLLRRWRALSDECKQMLARSSEERAFLLMLWRVQYREWLDGRKDELTEAWT